MGPVKMRTEAKNLIENRTGRSRGCEPVEDSVFPNLIICFTQHIPRENVLRTAYKIFPERDIQLFK